MFPQEANNQDRNDNDDGREARLRLVETMLSNEEREVSPGDLGLLDEVQLCASTTRTAQTRNEYRQMQEHFVSFLAAHGHDLTTAGKKHVEFFVAHLGAHDDPVVGRLVAGCGFCQGRGARPQGYSPTYVKRHLAAIKAAYDYLLEEGLVDVDPTLRVERPKVRAKRQYIPTVDEVRSLMAYQGTSRSRLALRWAYYAPGRRAEHVSARWSDIDEFGRWHLRAKGEKTHSYKLHPELVRALRAYGEHQQREARRHPAMAKALADPETAWVFMTKRGLPMTGGQFVRVLKRHAVRAGVAVIDAPSHQWDTVDGMSSRLTAHALRRAWGNHSLNDPDNPVPLDVVQMVLGHSDIRTTRQFYADTDNGRGDDALKGRRL